MVSRNLNIINNDLGLRLYEVNFSEFGISSIDNIQKSGIFFDNINLIIIINARYDVNFCFQIRLVYNYYTNLEARYFHNGTWGSWTTICTLKS